MDGRDIAGCTIMLDAPTARIETGIGIEAHSRSMMGPVAEEFREHEAVFSIDELSNGREALPHLGRGALMRRLRPSVASAAAIMRFAESHPVLLVNGR